MSFRECRNAGNIFHDPDSLDLAQCPIIKYTQEYPVLVKEPHQMPFFPNYVPAKAFRQ